MNWKYLASLFVFSCVNLGSHDSLAQKMDLQTILDGALKNSPEAARVQARIATLKSEGITTGTLLNPELDGEIRFPSSYESERPGNEATVFLSQPFRASDFGQRDKVRRLIEASSSAEEKVALLELSQTVRLQYVKAWALQNRRRSLQSMTSRIQKVEGVVENGAKNGSFAASDTELFKAARLKLENELIGIDADLSRATAALSQSAGFAVSGTLSDLRFSDEVPVESKDIPAIERVRLQTRIAQEQAHLARLDATPKISPRFVYERTGDGTDYLGVGVSFELPFFNRNQGERLKREADSTAMIRQLQYVEGPLFQDELEAAKKSYLSTLKQARSYRNQVIPALRAALEATEKSLQLGQGSPFQLWQALREVQEGDTHEAELWVKAQSELTELSLMIGQDF